jgi:hypothetical protein
MPTVLVRAVDRGSNRVAFSGQDRTVESQVRGNINKTNISGNFAAMRNFDQVAGNKL